jgi:WD40 repeat protein
MYYFLTQRLVPINQFDAFVSQRFLSQLIRNFIHTCFLFFFFLVFQGEHVVSVGGYIYLWDWRSGILVTKLKASSSCSAVTSVSFSSDAKFIVTAGKKHLKFWTVGSSPGTRLSNGTGSLAMHGKPVNLGPQKGSSFISVTSAIGMNNSPDTAEQAGDLFPIYVLTDEGWISYTITL